MSVATCATPASTSGAPPLTFGILSTYPPTPCGIATFSAALAAGLVTHGADVHVVRVADGAPPGSGPVVGVLENGSAASAASAVERLNGCDIVIVQHEYGLYGGDDGREVLDIVDALQVPTIVVAHTVLSQPTPHQRDVLVNLASLADRIVVMSGAARTRICNEFDADPATVLDIPHGASVPDPAGHRPADRPTLLTCGLVGPGKGIERVIDAMPRLHALPSRPRYVVAGQTHPKVLAADGESYRNQRIEQARRNGVAESVAFDDRYRDVAALTSMIQAATAVVLPYDSHDQATSGVLVDAIAAGRPVVATAFPHAVELLASGAGIVVDHDDPDAMADALTRLLEEPGLASRMAAEAQRLAPGLGWPVIAAAYLDVAAALLADRVAST